MARFATSAMSKDDRKATIPEELMVDKNTGEMLIRTIEGSGGHIVSFDATLAHKLHLSQFENTVTLSGSYGKIYAVPVNVDPLPSVIEPNVALLTTPLSITSLGSFERCMVSVDAVTVLLTDDVADIGPEPTVTISYKYVSKDNSVHMIEKTGPLSNSRTLLKIQELAEVYGPLKELSLNQITLTSNDVITTKHQTMLTSAMIFIGNEVE